MERKRAPRGAPWAVRSAPSRSGSRRLPGALGKASEGLRIADGDVGKHLPVELDLGQPQPVHQLAVAHALATSRRVDARDPQPPEVALAVAPVPVRVRVRLEQCLLGPLVAGVRLAPVALGAGEHGPALLARVRGALDPAHLRRRALTLARSGSDTSFCPASRRRRLAFFLPRMWLRMACRARSFPRGLSLKRFFAPECVLTLGMERLLKQSLVADLRRAFNPNRGSLPITGVDAGVRASPPSAPRGPPPLPTPSRPLSRDAGRGDAVGRGDPPRRPAARLGPQRRARRARTSRALRDRTHGPGGAPPGG